MYPNHTYFHKIAPEDAILISTSNKISPNYRAANKCYFEFFMIPIYSNIANLLQIGKKQIEIGAILLIKNILQCIGYKIVFQATYRILIIFHEINCFIVGISPFTVNS
jgi:hypothetical protein